MNIDDPKILAVRESVEAAQQEFDMAVMFHETWKPTAYDNDLHRRMGDSYATNTFNVLRVARRREMLLALMRLWDTPKHALRLEHIARALRDRDVISALAMDRVPFPEAIDQMKEDFAQRAEEVITLIDKYSRSGSDYAVRDKLRRIRNERLAHRDMIVAAATGPSATDQEIEAFYLANSEIVRLLLSVVKALTYNPAETGEVFSRYAAYFWAGVRGEETEGHPNYRPPT